jgi:hypothetical protein
MLTCLPVKRSTIHLAEISTAKTLRNGEVKMQIPKSDKVTLRRRTERLSIYIFVVKLFIERFVILGKSVVKLNEPMEIYVSKLAETEFSNPNYRSENLKVNLEKTYGKKIMFIKMETHEKFESYLVDKIGDIASLLRQEINDMFESEGSSLSWPPTAKYLNDLNFSLPEKLDLFLTSLLTGKKPRLQLQKLPV